MIPGDLNCLLVLLITLVAAKTIDKILSTVLRVQTEINPTALAAHTLGTKRESYVVAILLSGLSLTPEYLILKLQTVPFTGTGALRRLRQSNRLQPGPNEKTDQDPDEAPRRFRTAAYKNRWKRRRV